VTRNGNFFNLYSHDFVRIAVGVPSVRVADPAYNAEHTIALIRDAAERKRDRETARHPSFSGDPQGEEYQPNDQHELAPD